MRLALLIFALAAVGCADVTRPECGDKFLLLWPTALNEYKFQEVQIFTLDSPYEMKGDAAEIYFESGINESGFTSSVARPRLTHTPDRLCVPLDAQSSMAVTAYGHFEQLQRFDRDLQIADQVSWPRKVGVDIHLRSPDGRTHNNAHYFSKNDSVAVIPYNKSGVPMAVNPGVLAHEHFHSHFQTQVIAPLNIAFEDVLTVDRFFYSAFGFKPTLDDLENSDPGTYSGLNRFILRGWNEGLADFYAYMFSNEVNFFYDSLPDEGSNRDLSGYQGKFRTGLELRGQVEKYQMNRQSLLNHSYEQGTQLSRLLFRISMSGGISSRDLLRGVMNRLSDIPAIVKPSFHVRVLDPEEVVPVLLADVVLNKNVCDALNASLSKDLMIRRFSQCRL